MLTIATVALSILVTFRDMPTTPQMFDIPASSVDAAMLRFSKVTQTSPYLWLPDHIYIESHAVHGVFTPCEALRQMLDGTSVEVVNRSVHKVFCVPPHHSRPRRMNAAPIIDPPINRGCVRCLEISGIPTSLCRDDRDTLMFAHEQCDK